MADKLYDNLLVPEWRTAIYPADFADSVLKMIRTTTARIGSLVDLTQATERTRNYYQTYVVKTSDINSDGASFTFALPVADVDFFGNGLGKAIAIRGRDFSCSGNTYTFSEDPAKYGVVAIHNNVPVLELVGTGGRYTWNLAPGALAYHNCVDTPVVNAITESLQGDSPMGITHSLPECIGGCRLVNDPLIAVWTENDLKLGLTQNGELAYAPTSCGVSFRLGEIPSIPEAFGNLDFFVIPTYKAVYIIRLGLNDSKSYPGIIEMWPGLKLDGSGYFIGIDLVQQMLESGCIFYLWQYINNNDNRQIAVSRYLVNPGKVQIGVRATVDTSIKYNAGGPDTVPVKTITTTAIGYNFS